MATSFSFVRSLRTPTSERFIVQTGGKDVAAIDAHYQPQGVSATVIVFDTAVADAEIPALIQRFDEDFLPDVSLDDGKLIFTVVRGAVIDTLQADSPKKGAAQ